MEGNLEKPYYGYRINRYFAGAQIGLGIIGIALGIAFAISAYSTWVLILCWVLGVILLAFGIFWHLTMGFTADSKKMESIKDSFLDELGAIWDGKGKVLDIGTGRGWVAIEIAKRFPEAQVVGIDIWTKFFSLIGQTKAGAEKNARISKVSDRCTFQYGSALDLPFEDGEFQLVVSSFAFHEIHAPDRMVLFEEIAGLLAPGGTFLILDFFTGSFLKAYKVASVEELLEKVRQLGVENVKHKPLNETGVDLGIFYHHYWEIDFLSGTRI